MIYHELFSKHLRLGNFLFQIAATVNLCKKYGCETVYPPYYLWQHLRYPPKVDVKGSEPHDQLPEGIEFIASRKWEWTPEEEEWLHSFDWANKDYQLALNFFFQSAKWFEESESEVRKALEFRRDAVETVMFKYSDLFSKETVGIGLRLGDFINHNSFYQIPYDWYKEMVDKHFDRQKYNIVVFSDDIEKAKKIFWDQDFFYAEPNGTHTHADNFRWYHSPKAIEQFILGTLMDNFIIGNSTFSWWQAYLGAHKRGKVIHSGEVFNPKGPQGEIDTSNYYHEKWLKNSIT